MIAIVAGGRDYTDAKRVNHVLDEAVIRLGLHTIIEGAAAGADTLARDWALKRGDIAVIDVPADWDGWAARGQRGRAGSARNATMLAILLGGEKGTPRGLFAFPGGTGTANMLALGKSPDAVAAGVRVWEL